MSCKSAAIDRKELLESEGLPMVDRDVSEGEQAVLLKVRETCTGGQHARSEHVGRNRWRARKLGSHVSDKLCFAGSVAPNIFIEVKRYEGFESNGEVVWP
jgi:hypothetical protein